MPRNYYSTYDPLSVAMETALDSVFAVPKYHKGSATKEQQIIQSKGAYAIPSVEHDHSVTLREPWMPRPTFHTHEEGDRYVLKAATPGYSREELKIDLQDDILTITGEKAVGSNTTSKSGPIDADTETPQGTEVGKEKEGLDSPTVATEKAADGEVTKEVDEVMGGPGMETSIISRFRATFSQSFALPSSLHGQPMDATYTNGILTVNLFKPTKKAPTTISIA